MSTPTRDGHIGGIDDLLHDIFGNFLRPAAPPSSEMNITMGQLHCLGTIAHLGNPTMSQVAEALGLHPSTVTVLVDGLVAHGLARRLADPKDRRVVRVNETAKGRKNHERHMAQMRGRVTEMLSGLSEADLAKIHDSLAILRAAAKAYAEGNDSGPV
ncbi:MAG: MarR family transcriptional regulator [Armatimonadota bacterium]